ncbi:dTDP-4-dehydrorhamnose reductase [Herbaspirillum sp. CF444]|uniref:dTDP-4-dehydrorhamnose reductase n=1 Tax=Herbaspirillum sp. CF444 TaxID=1144319 RepID=UPI0002723430|nr:dTDP-4-dehydrorhamnose reductase [Herbaspirillum sp. CF444]EJL83430.1 dTDP-4-dehydrorhamnose reductase [Herbaspirillum sp. CF444]
MKILLTGQSGQIGNELALSLQGLGEIISFSRQQMDLADLDQIRDAIRATRPDLIVNPAAYTAVVKAESEPELAMRINGEAPGVIAEEAQRLGAPMVHYSTDYVFDGTRDTPYDEAAPTHPINVYGQSKCAGEEAIARHCEAYWILRTSWVYSVGGGNFLKTVIRLAQEQEKFTIVGDQFGAPTWSKTISDVTRRLLVNQQTTPGTRIDLDHLRRTSGIYNLTAAGETSWHGYASFIVDRLQALNVPIKVGGAGAITPVPSSTYPVPPHRPQNSRLSGAKLESTFAVAMPQWQTDVAACLDEIVREYSLADGRKLA